MLRVSLEPVNAFLKTIVLISSSLTTWVERALSRLINTVWWTEMFRTTIRNVDEKLYEQAKRKASEEGKIVGEIVNDALREWLESKEKYEGKAFLEAMENPRNWGMTDASKNIDKYVHV